LVWMGLSQSYLSYCFLM